MYPQPPNPSKPFTSALFGNVPRESRVGGSGQALPAELEAEVVNTDAGDMWAVPQKSGSGSGFRNIHVYPQNTVSLAQEPGQGYLIFGNSMKPL